MGSALVPLTFGFFASFFDSSLCARAWTRAAPYLRVALLAVNVTALYESFEAVVALLLERGAEIEAGSQVHSLEAAARNGHLGVARMLLRRALHSPTRVGQKLFWLLRSEMHEPHACERFAVARGEPRPLPADHRRGVGLHGVTRRGGALPIS